MPMRLRRKLVRRSGGRSSQESNIALRMNSNCFFRLRGFCFFARLDFCIRFFQRYQNSEILGASGGSFAFNNVGQTGHQKLIASKPNLRGSAPHGLVGADAVDANAEVQLQRVAFAHQPEHL